LKYSNGSEPGLARFSSRESGRPAAQYRVNNIAKLRELDSARVPVLSQARIEGPQWGIWGEARVNVLGSNLALERLAANVRDVSET